MRNLVVKTRRENGETEHVQRLMIAGVLTDITFSVLWNDSMVREIHTYTVSQIKKGEHGTESTAIVSRKGQSVLVTSGIWVDFPKLSEDRVSASFTIE
ncbi:MAG: hypothetical protein J5825_08985 [Lachnospiraceae bacterium]|nr:hypothetical protein [Lachnospiraceae bacterium]